MLGIGYFGIEYGIAIFYVGSSKQYDQTRLIRFFFCQFFVPFVSHKNMLDYQSLHEFIKILQKPSFIEAINVPEPLSGDYKYAILFYLYIINSLLTKPLKKARKELEFLSTTMYKTFQWSYFLST